jgi:Ca2+-binding EF-hand superfamily protein
LEHAEFKKSEDRLMDLFESGDPDRSGRISRQQWKAMLDDKTTRLELNEGTHLTKDDMVDIFDCLAIDDDDDDDMYIDYKDLIHSLKANATVADKRSVLHVMIRLRAMQDAMKQQREEHQDQLNSRFDELKKLIALKE